MMLGLYFMGAWVWASGWIVRLVGLGGVGGNWGVMGWQGDGRGSWVVMGWGLLW